MNDDTLKTGPYTDDETERLGQMVDAGLSWIDIGTALGRKADAVRKRWRWYTMPDEEKARRKEQERTRTRTRMRDRVTGIRIGRHEPSEAQWGERNRRINAPRTLGQELMGDPPYEQSALGRRADNG